MQLTAAKFEPALDSQTAVCIQYGLIMGIVSKIKTNKAKKPATPAVILRAGEEYFENQAYSQQLQHPLRLGGLLS